jgi:thymidylate kinase
MRTVALIGPDGAGKSTIAREIERTLPARSRYVYMGINPASSSHRLPTTRVAQAIRRARRTASNGSGKQPGPAPTEGRTRASGKGAYRTARTFAWMAEEWYRAILARAYTARGYLVIFDRHFLYDYGPGDGTDGRGGSRTERLRRRILRRFYPRPDLVVCLDAPPEVLHERKRDPDLETLARVRREYLALSDLGPEFVVIDAARPLPAVVAEVRGVIEARLK